MATEPSTTNWDAVIARSLAYLALHQAELGNSDIGEQAVFLESLGLSRADTAAMLGTTSNSLGVLINRMKGRRRGKSKG